MVEGVGILRRSTKFESKLCINTECEVDRGKLVRERRFRLYIVDMPKKPLRTFIIGL